MKKPKHYTFTLNNIKKYKKGKNAIHKPALQHDSKNHHLRYKPPPPPTNKRSNPARRHHLILLINRSKSYFFKPSIPTPLTCTHDLPIPIKTHITMGANGTPRGLIVGNYCHDVLIKDDVVLAQTLGGAVSFVAAVLDGLKIPADYISKVGSDFLYNTEINYPAIVSLKNTTVFHAYFVSDPSEIRREDRVLKRIRSCDPISPCDLPDGVNFSFGMAVGIGGEISPETLEKMVDICDVVLVDVQALIRVFDEIDGTVKLVNLKDTKFNHLIPRIGFLKASAEEAPYVDVDEVRKLCCVVVTSGKDGCTVYWKDGEVQISPFETVQVDPTGAGDSFLGGLVAGLVEGLKVPDAALVGNFFGSLTVGQVGPPELDSRLMQKVKYEVHTRKMQCDGHDEESRFTKPRGHEQFTASLSAAKSVTARTVSPNIGDEDLDPKPGYTSNQMLFLKNSVYEEPIASIDAKP